MDGKLPYFKYVSGPCHSLLLYVFSASDKHILFLTAQVIEIDVPAAHAHLQSLISVRMFLSID
jgi:hypothetical protein